METELNEEAKSLIRSSLSMEAKILELGLLKWKTKLKNLESQYEMSSEEFIDKFNKGELGDDKIWFEWMFAYKAYSNVKSKLQLIRKINL